MPETSLAATARMRFQTGGPLIGRVASRAIASAAMALGGQGVVDPAAASPCAALVQGASRGLGLEFTQQLLQRPGTQVVATCRDPAAAAQLQELQRAVGPQRLSVVQLDCTSEESIEDRKSVV